MDEKDIPQTEQEFKDRLTPEQYSVLREKGTEAPFSGKLPEPKDGFFRCVACGNPLFKADAKFESGISSLAGWPSFDQAIPGSVKMEHDLSLGMNRTEVLCAKCNSHLGHIFEDKDSSTGKHFCVNAVCLG